MQPAPHLADRIASLSPEKRALLQSRLTEAQNAARARADTDHPIERLPADADLPLSFAQQRLWYLDHILPAKALYNVPTTWRVRGPLDIPALQRSLDLLVHRHAILRTRFTAGEEGPVQVIAAAEGVALPLIDLTGYAEPERRARALDLAREHASRCFDLQNGPIFRARVLRVASDEHWLLLNVHHIAFDGWSAGIFERELSAAYRAFAHGSEPELPAAPLRYADFAAWQRRWLTGEVLDRQIAYWKKRLADIAPLDLPADRARPLQPSHSGAQFSAEIPVEVVAALKALGACEGATLFMTLLAGLQLLLGRYSGQQDVAVGTPIGGRPRVELEGVVGFFVNTLVMRTDLSGSPSFRELLHRVRATALDAYGHQDLPFERLVEELAAPRDPGRHPLFQVLFALHSASEAALALDGLDVERVSPGSHGAKFDLTVTARESGTTLRLTWQYATDLFDAATIESMAAHFTILLGAAAADPDGRIDALPMLSASERKRLLIDWNDTATAYPRDATIHELFEAQAARSPDAPAVVGDRHVLSYASLDACANQLAHHLVEQGVGPGALVGVCLDRCPEFVTAVLAVLKAGAAYVPLDPAYPAQRIHFMLADTAAGLVITTSTLLEDVSVPGRRLVRLDAEADAIAARPTGNPGRRGNGEDLAYVMYTSGSSGEPKGVRVPHRAVVRLLLGGDYVRLDARQTLLLLSPISFDASTFELWSALLHGARCAIFGDRVPSIDRLGEVLRCYEVSTLWLTASLFNVIVDEAPLILRGVRQLLTGGEPLSITHVRAAQKALPGVQLINGYGPTETVTFACCHRIPETLPNGRTSIPIGRPIANTSVYILEPTGEPAPVGVPGELWIGGDGVAHGYLNRPQLTAQKFVRDPFSTLPDARMYRTGDRARYLPDSTIEFLGRFDQQVKIRGFRIEPGEVEAVLARHPDLRDVVVVAREDVPGDKRLVGYVVPVSPAWREVDALCGFVRERLPDYMCPSAYVVLERLPLGPAGKVDRRALPPPERARGAATPAFVPARNALEELVADTWREVLKLERIGVHDDFFALGGHSLLAAQVIARLTRRLGIELPLRAFVDAPTVASLAAEAGQRLDGKAATPVLPVEVAARAGDLPLSFAQQRLWFLDRLLPDRSAYNVPAAWRLRGSLDVRALQRSLDLLVMRHETLRTRYAHRDGEPVQVIERAAPVELAVADLSPLAPEARETCSQELVRAHARQRFDLEARPPFSVQLVRLASEEHLLLLNVHHIAFDGWSQAVFNRELAVAYQATREGHEPALPALPLQYADYASWQRRWLSGAVLERQLDYWRERLAGLQPLNLPTDRPRASTPTYDGARISFDLPASLTAALKVLARREGTTLFMTLLAGFMLLLHRCSRQADVAVGTPIAGRTRDEFEGLIGFFVNTLVLRADLSGAPTFRGLLARVRETALGAYSHQDVPFEKLVSEFPAARDLRRSPLFQVLFVLQNAPGQGLALDGIEATRLPGDDPSAKFELSVSVREANEGLHTTWQYATALFEVHTIERMAAQFQALLETMVAEPGRTIADVPAPHSLHPGPDPAREEHERRAVAPYCAPRDDLERTLCAIWTEVLAVERVGIDDDFFDLGGHSLLATRMFARLDRALGRTLPLETLFKSPTVRALARSCRPEQGASTATALVTFNAAGSLPPLFGVAPGDGNILNFGGLVRHLGREQPFFGLQYIGIDGATEPLETTEAIARGFVQEMRTVQPAGPYQIVGVCFGATVAFEITRQLVQAGEAVAFLGLLDPSPPILRESAPPASRLPRPLARAAAFVAFVTGRLRLYREQMRSMGIAERVRFVVRKSALLPRMMAHRDVFRGNRREFDAFRVHEANRRALLRYRPQSLPLTDTRVEIFATAHHADTTPARSCALWSVLVGKPIPYHRVPGDNTLDMLQNERAAALVRLISARLHDASPGKSPGVGRPSVRRAAAEVHV